ncbi:MAG TPA: o-succinylbenzoate synthase [Longimicrobiales bacterium]|nr:o-succinylbenzoate synthase [Longimicrobiales bacterium]
MSFRVTKLWLREIRLPLREPFRISSGSVTERRIGLVALHPDGGTKVWAECVAGARPNYSPETLDTAWLALREWIGPLLLGTSWSEPSEVHDLLQPGIRGHRMAKATLEMGCWALAAQARGQSLAEILGGTRERIATGISLGIQDSPEALVEKARQAFEAGYRKVKLKIAPGADLAYVGAVREALGPEAHLMADANSAYTLADADHLARLDPFDLMMIEQPLAHDDLVRHAELQRRLKTPICLDESITDVDRAEDMLTLGSGRIVNIKPGRVGGFTSSKAIHDLCHARGVPVWCGGMLESGVGRAYNVALASLPGFTLPGDLSPSARYWARDIVEPEWTMGPDGMVDVPWGRPGLGIAVDEDRIDDLTVQAETVLA